MTADLLTAVLVPLVAVCLLLPFLAVLVEKARRR